MQRDSSIGPAWQRGYPLETLQRYAAPFRKRHGPLCFGAFGMAKEREIAAALESNALASLGDPPQAVAIVRAINQPSKMRDFTGALVEIETPCYYVTAIAALSAQAGADLLRELNHRAGEYPLYVELFEEDEVAGGIVRDLGYRYCAGKVMAGSEIKGIYSPSASGAREYPPEETATLCQLREHFLGEAELGETAAMLARYAELWQQHYSNYNKRKSWTAFALRGYDDDPGFIMKPQEMSMAWKKDHPELLSAAPRWLPIAEAFPAVRLAIEALGCQVDRVRFMRLRAADGELSRHADITDREAGAAVGKVARLHCPIVTSERVAFHAWDHRGRHIERSFPPGSLFYLDQRKPHRVVNEDPSLDRIHLVIDAIATEALSAEIGEAGRSDGDD